jgi:hypothetical protein
MASNKFEEMLEKLVNEDKAGAEELFHEIVVEKSREIYEGLLESDLEVDETTDEEVDETTDEEVDEASDEEVDEASDDDDKEEATNEDFNLDEFEVEGGDPADDMMDKMGMDMDGDAEGGDGMDMDMDAEGGEEEIEDRVDDLEVALDDLKAEFEKMMGDDNDDEGEEDEDDMDIDPDADAEEEPEEESYNFEASDEEVEEAADEETDESTKSEAETMREYVEKVTAKMGDNGANTKSTVASANNMGGTASNLVAGGEADTKGTTGGLAAPSEKEDNAGNVNVPGGKAAKSNKAMPKGHGAEKKGAGDTAANKKPVIGG